MDNQATDSDQPLEVNYWRILLQLELIALLVAFVMPVAPSKTGSKWSPGSLFFEEPAYLHDVAIWFFILGLSFALLVAGAVIKEHRDGT